MRGDYGKRTFKKTRGIIPEWASQLLLIATIPNTEQNLASPDEDKLAIALAARIATDPNTKPNPDIATRKAHLEAWLQAYPNAPLALMRMADLAVEEEDWANAVKRLENIWKQGYRSAARAKPQLAQAWLERAKQEPQHAMEHLRKAYRMNPSDTCVAISLGQAHIQANNPKAASKFWLAHLSRHDDLQVAQACFELLQGNALKAFQKLEHEQGNMAMQWLKAKLAHAGNLDGLADEILSKLITEHPCREFWHTQAQWFTEKQQWDDAKKAYEKALSA
jgi:lipopolysaccharide biosynthesis regulator YciM